MTPPADDPTPPALRDRLAHCDLCPRRCGVDRRAGTGVCGTGERAVVHAAYPHFGEERVLVGRGGSGTIFLAGCNLRCRFCQNEDISHGGGGRPVDDASLAGLMLDLQAAGCGNVNLVTPSHVAPQAAAAVVLARRGGLRVPIVWNTSAYDDVATLRALEGLVDVYLPDCKSVDPAWTAAVMDAPDYPEVARAAIREMHRQAGDLRVGRDGRARRGVLVRHLAMPGRLDDARAVMAFLATLSPDLVVNVMDQYRPLAGAWTCPGIARRTTDAEVEAVLAAAREAGLRRAGRM